MPCWETYPSNTVMNTWSNQQTNNWWMDESMNGWMNEPTNERMKEWRHEWRNEWMNEWRNECMNEGMNERMDGWMNEWMNESNNKPNVQSVNLPWIKQFNTTMERTDNGPQQCSITCNEESSTSPSAANQTSPFRKIEWIVCLTLNFVMNRRHTHTLSTARGPSLGHEHRRCAQALPTLSSTLENIIWDASPPSNGEKWSFKGIQYSQYNHLFVNNPGFRDCLLGPRVFSSQHTNTLTSRKKSCPGRSRQKRSANPLSSTPSQKNEEWDIKNWVFPAFRHHFFTQISQTLNPPEPLIGAKQERHQNTHANSWSPRGIYVFFCIFRWVKWMIRKGFPLRFCYKQWLNSITKTSESPEKISFQANVPRLSRRIPNFLDPKKLPLNSTEKNPQDQCMVPRGSSIHRSPSVRTSKNPSLHFLFMSHAFLLCFSYWSGTKKYSFFISYSCLVSKQVLQAQITVVHKSVSGSVGSLQTWHTWKLYYSHLGDMF